jgi:hypothetical protein
MFAVSKTNAMKIYDSENKKVLPAITLFLTPSEALELAQSAKDLAENPNKHHHHINDPTYKMEITVAVYTPDNIIQFDAESRGIIGETLQHSHGNDKVES